MLAWTGGFLGDMLSLNSGMKQAHTPLPACSAYAMTIDFIDS